MPESASPGQALGSFNLAHETDINLESHGLKRKFRPNRAGFAVDGETTENQTHSIRDKDRRRNDFDKVLTRKIDGQRKQKFDEHSQPEATAAEPSGDKPTEKTSSSALVSENNDLESTNEKVVFEHSTDLISSSSDNIDSTQTASMTGVIVEVDNHSGLIADVGGETETSQDQPKTQPFAQGQGASVTLTELQSNSGQNKTASAGSIGQVEVSVDEKQVQAPKAAVTESVAGVQNNAVQNNDTEDGRPLLPEAMTQTRKLVSLVSDPETPKATALTATGLSQEKTHDAKESKTVPLEVPPVSGEHDGVPKGLEMRNVQSILHHADSSGNASLAALEAPARNAVHADVRQVEIAKPVDQILQHLSSVSVSGPQQRIQLTLTPEDLGTIRMTFNRTEDEVVGLLEVQKNQTRRQVEQALPQLISAMQNNGVQVRRIEIVRWDAVRDGVGDGAANGSDDLGADQSPDKSSKHSSESSMFANPGSSENSPESMRFGRNAAQEHLIYHPGTIGDAGLNMFI